MLERVRTPVVDRFAELAAAGPPTAARRAA
jgi:hypothetical protein